MKTTYLYSFLLIPVILMASCEKEKTMVEEPSEKMERTHSIPLQVALSNLENYLNSEGCNATKSESEKRKIATIDTLRNKSLTTKSSMPDMPSDCDNMIYVVNFENNEGYALLSADDRITDDIIAITDSGSMSADKLSSSYNAVFGENPITKGGIYMEGDLEAYDEDADDWYIGDYTGGENDPTILPTEFIGALVVGYVGEQIGHHMGLPEMPSVGGEGNYVVETVYTDLGTVTVVPNLLSCFSSWTQVASPYNDFTPNNYPAGCVNIALGKILAYFEGPGTIICENYIIDWYALKYNPSSTAGRLSAGRLMEALGIACDSWYIPFGLGTFTLPSKAAAYLTASNYSGVSYSNYSNAAVKTALNAGCPVFVSAINYTGLAPDITCSHAWNIDGYQTRMIRRTDNYYLDGILVNSQSYTNTSTLVHCAFGWHGMDDGYFSSGVFSFYSTALGKTVNYCVYLKTITYNNPNN